MKPMTTQQEVLLMMDTEFVHRTWANNEGEESAGLSAIEQLEKACWDGLVKDLIPELDIAADKTKKLWLWQIHVTSAFLALDFFEYPGPKDNEFSIDPQLIMEWHCQN